MAKKHDWRLRPANEVERLVSAASPAQVEAAQERLIRSIVATNYEAGCTAPRFEQAVRQLHADPTLMRDVAPEFRIPVVAALRAAVGAAEPADPAR